MKPGADNPKKVVIAAVLLILAVGFFVYMASDKDSLGRASGSGTKQPRVTLKTSARDGFNPFLRTNLLRSSEDTVYASTGRNIFVAKSDPPPPPECAPLGGPSRGLKWCEPIGPPLRPPQPPIALSFFGFASKPGEPKKVFLSQGGDIFIASEGDIVDRRYKIVRITATLVEVQDMINNSDIAQPIRLNN